MVAKEFPLSNEFRPDWVSCPGETVAELIRNDGRDRVEIEMALTWGSCVVDEVISGKRKIDLSYAQDLSRVVGGSVQFWLNRESNYRVDLERIRADCLQKELDSANMIIDQARHDGYFDDLPAHMIDKFYLYEKAMEYSCETQERLFQKPSQS